MNGFIFLHRKLKDWRWYSDPVTSRVFIHILLSANHKTKPWRDLEIPAGSFVTGRKALSYETGMSEQQVRTALDKLKSTNEITIQATNNYSIITVVKWSEYQGKKPAEQPTNNQPYNQRITTTNNDNNIINNNYPPISPQGGNDDGELFSSNDRLTDDSAGKSKPATRKRGDRLEAFMAANFPDQPDACPQEWGEAAVEAAIAFKPNTTADFTKLVNWHFSKFHAHFTSTSKANGVKKDWRMAWLNWWKSEWEKIAKQEERDELFAQRNAGR